MGSFNVACSVSSIPIQYGDKVVYFLLYPSRFWKYKENQNGLSYICSNDSVYALYNIISLPIYGIYDDMGKLCNIERNYIVECLESYFGQSIEKLMDDISSGEYNNARFEDQVYGTYILRDVYDRLSNLGFTSIMNEYPTSYMLDQLGFKYIRNDKHIDRYNNIYTYPGIPESECYIKSDGTWSHIWYKGKTYDDTYDLERFIKQFFNLSGIILSLNKCDSIYKYKVEQLQKEITGRDSFFREVLSDISSYFPIENIYFSTFYDEYIITGNNKFKEMKYAMMSDLYEYNLDAIKIELIKYSHFFNSLSKLNKIFQISIYAGQTVDYNHYKKYISIMNDIIRQKEVDDFDDYDSEFCENCNHFEKYEDNDNNDITPYNCSNFLSGNCIKNPFGDNREVANEI